MRVNFEIGGPAGNAGRYRRPYVAVWIEDKDGLTVRTLALWLMSRQPGPRWHRRPEAVVSRRPGPPAGRRHRPDRHDLACHPSTRKVHHHLGRQGRPWQAARVPAQYTVCIEAAREHGHVPDHPQGSHHRRQAVRRGAQGQCRDQVRLDRVSTKGFRTLVNRRPEREQPLPSRRRLDRVRTAAVMRWLHIYVSMFGLAAVLFFSVTGPDAQSPGLVR